ncbi:MAG: hypothetical protein F6K09_19225 [Merismopedia sp. SIO2A8]|nr:hypothetical protein [Merismopedia sp. SIO2A8]
MQLNDNFADSFDLIGSSDSAIGSNVGFTGEPGEPNHAGISPPLNSAWWSWRAPASGVVKTISKVIIELHLLILTRFYG